VVLTVNSVTFLLKYTTELAPKLAISGEKVPSPQECLATGLECLDKCRNYVKSMLRAGCLKNQHFDTAIPTFCSLLDGEILSLFGINWLVDPMWYFFVLKFQENSSISLLTLSLYLIRRISRCQKKQLRWFALWYAAVNSRRARQCFSSWRQRVLSWSVDSETV